jgi:hypothetical protein
MYTEGFIRGDYIEIGFDAFPEQTFGSPGKINKSGELSTFWVIADRGKFFTDQM